MSDKLMFQANNLLKIYPNKMVLFVTSNPSLAAARYLKIMNLKEIPQNLGFINHFYFLEKRKTIQDYVALVDELNPWLEQMNIISYD